MFFAKIAAVAALALSALAAPIAVDVAAAAGIATNAGAIKVLTALRFAVAPKLAEIRAIAQNPKAAADAAAPAAAAIVDALHTASSSLHSLVTVPSAPSRRDTTDDVARMTASIVNDMFVTLQLAHGPAATVQDLVPNVGAALADVLAGLSVVVPGVLAIVSGLLGSVVSLVSGLNLDGVLGGLLN